MGRQQQRDLQGHLKSTYKRGVYRRTTITDYDYWKTDPDHDYAGQRTYLTPEEEDLRAELSELYDRESSLQYELDEIRDRIEDIERDLGL